MNLPRAHTMIMASVESALAQVTLTSYGKTRNEFLGALRLTLGTLSQIVEAADLFKFDLTFFAIEFV